MSITAAITVAALLIALTALIVWRLRRAREPVTVGPLGIQHRGLGPSWIRWEEIEGAYPPTAGHDALRLRVRLSPRLLRGLRRRRRLAPEIGVGDSVEIDLALDRSRHSALELMQQILSHPAPPLG